MSADRHVRAAADSLVTRERLALAALFSPPIARALERYYADAVLRGLSTDATLRALADLLAPHGLADPSGRAPVTLAVPPQHPGDVRAAYELAGLARFGVSVDEFRAEHARRARESITPLSPRTTAAALAAERAQDGSRGRVSGPWARVVRGWRWLRRLSSRRA